MAAIRSNSAVRSAATGSDLTYIHRPNGDFTFSGQYTGNAAADFLLGYPIQFRQGSGGPRSGRSVFHLLRLCAGRIPRQPTPHHTYGMRYEVNQPFADARIIWPHSIPASSR